VANWGLQMDIVAVPAAPAGAFGAFWLNWQIHFGTKGRSA